MNFEGRYTQLNEAQRAAVDAIDGPVMVIAGPGTGKTELLSMRVANILRRTDALPENILCLTYTDAGATAMRRRLIDVIGTDAYKVAIHTFHSFGTEAINQNREYFFNGADFSPADELVTYQVLNDLLGTLPLNHPLAKQMNGEFSERRRLKKVIEEFKRAGLTPKLLRQTFDANQAAIDTADTLLTEAFAGKISKTTLPLVESAYSQLKNLPVPEQVGELEPWISLLTASLEVALQEASNHPRVTPPLTAWRNQWMRTNASKQYVVKAAGAQEKLRLVTDFYEAYLVAMEQRSRFDYDDMILQVVQALEQHDDFRFTLQEKFQYLLVDEFQDTNLAQLRILHLLTENAVNEGNPNIFVVGDPDQAIYSFQGADISNILNFEQTYPSVTEIILTQNYRSTQGILDGSREIITQSSERLADRTPELNKPLVAASEQVSAPKLYEAPGATEEYSWVADAIKRHIDQGIPPSSIAILMSKHAQLQAMLPYLYAHNIPVSYDRQDDALSLSSIEQIVSLARVVTLLADQRHREANALLPELLAHPAWGFNSTQIWQLSARAHHDGKLWLESMETLPEFELWRNWLLELVTLSYHTPLDQMIDRLLGTPNNISIQPAHTLYEYFFSGTALTEKPAQYLECVEALIAVREKALEHQEEHPTLSSFVALVDLYKKAGVKIPLGGSVGNSDAAVQVMTAHGSKGLEFDHVFVVGVSEDNWKPDGSHGDITYTENLSIIRRDTSADERLRLFYVALTRAKRQLTITYSTSRGTKPILPARFLANWEAASITADESIESKTERALISWHNRLIEPVQDLRDFLASRLENYRLTATDLTKFLNLKYGGPQEFVTRSLLRFPSASTPHSQYGNAVHDTLRDLHLAFLVDQTPPELDTALNLFEAHLKKQGIQDGEFTKFHEKGIEELTAYMIKHGPLFTTNQHPELNLSRQESQLGDVRLGGRLDLTDINKEDRTIAVIDYKTSKTETTWSSSSDSLHHYRHQLMFYKLLVENSRDYHNYTVVRGAIDYVKPLPNGEVVTLNLEFDRGEMERFEKLVTAVWHHITSLTIPDTSGYSPDLKGTKQFEEDLINGVI